MHKDEAHIFIQWKGTDVCLDIDCSCGHDWHYDGYSFGVITCPECGKHWGMPGPCFDLTKAEGSL